MICDVLPSATLAVTRYAPAFCSGVVTVMRLSKCFSRGSRSSFQLATSAPMYFLLFFLDEPIADVGDVHLLPIELLGLAS